MFYIDENNSIHYRDGIRNGQDHPRQEDAFASPKGFGLVAAQRKWSKQTVTDIWNGFAGDGPFIDLKPCRCFRNRPYGLGRIWEAIQRLVPAEVASDSTVAAELPTQGCPDCDGTGETCANCGAVDGVCDCGLANEMGTCDTCGGSGQVVFEPDEPEQSTTPILDEEVKVKPAARKPKKKTAKKTAKPAPVVVVKEGSNVEVLIRLASRKHGVSVEEAMKATGWSSCHSVRGRFSVLGSKGMNIERTKHATRGTVYRLVA